jgi:hypothetical protein
MRPPARFIGELGVGLLTSPRAMPPQAAFSVLMSLRVSRWLRVELSVLAPLFRMVREVADTTLQARASLFGGGLQFAVYRQPRWDLSAALGAGPGLVAHRQSDAAWNRSLSVSLYGRVAGGIQLSHALSLRLDVSVGTLIDAVLLDSPGGPAWGGVWLGSTLGFVAGFD